MVLHFLLLTLFGCGGADELDLPNPPPKWPMGSQTTSPTNGGSEEGTDPAKEAVPTNQNTTPDDKSKAKEPIVPPNEPEIGLEPEPEPDEVEEQSTDPQPEQP